VVSSGWPLCPLHGMLGLHMPKDHAASWRNPSRRCRRSPLIVEIPNGGYDERVAKALEDLAIGLTETRFVLGSRSTKTATTNP